MAPMERDGPASGALSLLCNFRGALYFWFLTVSEEGRVVPPFSLPLKRGAMKAFKLEPEPVDSSWGFRGSPYVTGMRRPNTGDLSLTPHGRWDTGCTANKPNLCQVALHGTPAKRPPPDRPPTPEMCCGTEAGSYLRLIDSCITQLKAQGPSRTCDESKEEPPCQAKMMSRWRCSASVAGWALRGEEARGEEDRALAGWEVGREEDRALAGLEQRWCTPGAPFFFLSLTFFFFIITLEPRVE